MNCVICAIAKNENAYLLEWATYHLSKGFSHIYLYDNNDLGGEQVLTVFDSSVIQNKVTVVDIRGKKYFQKQAYNDCYYRFKFDWCAFIDIDEFIAFDDPSGTIESFLVDKYQFEAVHLNWKCFGDNNQVTYSPNLVRSRFTDPIIPLDFRYTYLSIPENSHIKSIIKKGLSIDWTKDTESFESNPHTPSGLFHICNSSGNPLDNSPFAPIDTSMAFICHYMTKSIEEYQTKISRQCADCSAVFYSVEKFFRVNPVTVSKIVWLYKNRISFSLKKILKERVKYITINNHLPLRFLFQSLRK